MRANRLRRIGFGIASAKSRLIAPVAVAVLALAGCSDGQVGRSDNANQAGYIEGDGVVTLLPPEDRAPAPAFTGTLLTGEEFRLADEVGDVVVLNVWGSWCPPCRKEAPDLQAAYENLRDEGVQFIGINTRDTTRAAQAFEEEFTVTYPSIFDPKGESLLAFRDALPPAAIPSTLVIDRDGKLAASIVGPIGETSLSQLVGDIATEEPAATS